MSGAKARARPPARRISGPARAALTALALLACTSARAAEAPEVAQACLACHGEALAEGAPPIAGHSSNYIQLQLVFFRAGRRKSLPSTILKRTSIWNMRITQFPAPLLDHRFVYLHRLRKSTKTYDPDKLGVSSRDRNRLIMLVCMLYADDEYELVETPTHPPMAK